MQRRRLGGKQSIHPAPTQPPTLPAPASSRSSSSSGSSEVSDYSSARSSVSSRQIPRARGGVIVGSSEASTVSMNTPTTEEEIQAELKRQAIIERKNKRMRDKMEQDRLKMEQERLRGIRLQSQAAGSVHPLISSLQTRTNFSDIPRSERSNSMISDLTNSSGYGSNSTSSSDVPSDIGTMGSLRTIGSLSSGSARSGEL